jgi:hypothetical protein
MATLTVTHTENIVLNGRQQGSTQTMRIPNITQTYSRIIQSGANAAISLYTTSNTGSGGAVFDDGSVKYVRITNLAKESLVINIKAEGTFASAYEIGSNQSYYLYSHNLCFFADDADAITGAEMKNSLEDIDDVQAICLRSALKVELFIASEAPHPL